MNLEQEAIYKNQIQELRQMLSQQQVQTVVNAVSSPEGAESNKTTEYSEKERGRFQYLQRNQRLLQSSQGSRILRLRPNSIHVMERVVKDYFSNTKSM
ncbi:hypothetical protein JTB14_015968 [Gonioctena quinquepunctata]|nr:hypothetical protein JTB14_015968 [Gonioctena quinquepunctata]